MKRYKLSSKARGDIRGILAYIARDSLPAAKRLEHTFLEKFTMLANNPLMGEVRGNLALNLRMFTTGNYVILFRPYKYGVEIVQVVHAARDLDAVFRKPE